MLTLSLTASLLAAVGSSDDDSSAKRCILDTSNRADGAGFDQNRRHDDADPIGRVANDFKGHGGQPGKTVAIPASLQGDLPSGFEMTDKRPLKPPLTADAFDEAGIRWTAPRKLAVPLSLIRATRAPRASRVALGICHVLTCHNHSTRYARAVYRPSMEIRAGLGRNA